MNKTDGLSIQLKKLEVPEFKQSKAYQGNWYIPGENGSWFDGLMYLYDNCSTHASIINNLQRRICKGYEDDAILMKITLDFLITGCYSIEVLWNINHTKIITDKHLDSSKVRIGLIDEEKDEPLLYYYSNDWLKYNNRNIEPFHTFSTNPNTDDHQLFYHKRYNPQGNNWAVYSKPYYYSCLRSIYTDIEIDKFYSNLVANNFTANSILSIGGFMDEGKQEEFEKQLKKNFTGSENAGSMIVLYSENADNKPEIIKFNGEGDDEKYSELKGSVEEKIYRGHNVPPSLAGVMYSGKLGNATELPLYEDIYNKFVVEPIRNEILSGYDKIKNNLLVKS